MVSQELLAFLVDLAAKLSGYPPIPVDALPPVQVLSEAELAKAVCPDAAAGCTNIAATFETEHYVIYVRDTLDLENAADNSFLLHELVHVLQHKARGDAIFADCPTTLKTETEAYQAQNAYLKREGQFLRFGEALGFMSCAGEQNTFFTRDIMIDPLIVK
ncbi:MAG: hypothetical protein ACOY7P_01120 [Pseudomonadota bacterium]